MDNEKNFIKADELYENGDYKSAFDMFLKGAKSGDTSCMLRLALMYSTGEGVEFNYDKAEEWELKAINSGDPTGMINLGITYRMKGDIRKSKEWFEKSLKSGDGSAALELAKLYMVSKKETETVIGYLKQAISNDDMCEADIEEAEKLLSEFTLI